MKSIYSWLRLKGNIATYYSTIYSANNTESDKVV